MKTYKMVKSAFPDFIELIKTKGKLFGPVKQKSKYSFEEISDIKDLDFDYQRTVLGVKKFLTPPRYKTLTFNKEGTKDIIDEPETNIVIGVHPCDIHAVKILDRLFLGNIKDPYYASKRENLTIIGHSCLPDDKCLCQSTGTDMVEDGFDLFLTELEDYYLVWVGSDKGLALTIAASDLMSEEISDESIREYVRWQQKRSSMFKTVMPSFKYMADIITLNYDSEIWEQFGEKCLSCGTCSLVCPTCNCFNVDDKILMNAEEGFRERMLDSCTLPYYSMVAGDHDFRPDRTTRLKLYYTHKLKEYIGRWGQPGCVGCGRCVTYCPVDINVLTVSEALFGEVCETKEVCE
ncbi:MAG: 4Fe-4S dicluster domain-containing protein [Candidatus Heimdallarchaeota archaeon]|nr:4Fe-4S dicluster domain-containing protein [Candidatus Heimdallarchaeota archaeon]MCK4254347.1 4Fe-4S dicluster domain-containing protein [Candidatus Heimdallarchaeota archaeon]